MNIKRFADFVKENEIEIGGLDMVRIVCKKYQIQHECPEISAEYLQPVELKRGDEKKKVD